MIEKKSYLEAHYPKGSIIIADEALPQGKILAEKIHAPLITLKGGESCKTLETFESLVEQLCELKADRKTTLVGLGGGTVTDLVGFTAAVFMRGVEHMFVPTTLVGMVDAAIGGKCAINTKHGKNLVGAVHFPIQVIIDETFLKTLPEKELKNGRAEMIKMHLVTGVKVDVESAIKAKMKIVEKDPHDTGLRRVLNFGHTIAHALETACGISHGEAVAIGSATEAHLSQELGLLDDFSEVLPLYNGFDLQLPKHYSREQLLSAMQYDKKNASGKVRCVLLEEIGKAHSFDGAYVRPITPDELIPSLEWMEMQYS